MHDDLALMKNPSQWPNNPFLTVKRYEKGDSWPKCALMIDDDDLRCTVVEVNLFTLRPEKYFEQISSAKKHKYDSLEALVADGWVVD